MLTAALELLSFGCDFPPTSRMPSPSKTQRSPVTRSPGASPESPADIVIFFSIFIELINMQHRRKAKPVHLRNPYGEETGAGGDERRALEQAESMVHDASAEASAAAIDAVGRACPPGHVEPLRLRAMWEAAQGRFAPAATLLATAIERERDDALLHNTLGVVLAATAAMLVAKEVVA